MSVSKYGLRAVLLSLSLTLSVFMTGCGGSSGNSDSVSNTPGAGTGGDTPPTARTTTISPGPNATQEALAAFISAGTGDTIVFDAGFFDITETLLLQNVENITVRGAGKDATVLSFQNAVTVEGISGFNSRGITIEDLTVADTGGDGVRIQNTDFVTYQNMRVIWSSANTPITATNFADEINVACPAQRLVAGQGADYQVSSENGRYGVYPVQSRNVLIDNVDVVGASDAGIYVGQSNDIIVRNSRAAFNVAGFEIENSDRADMFNNVAECNTGGFLVFDLPGLSQFGDITRVFDNVARNNNTENFAAGGIVGAVPRGTGILVLAYDRVEIFGNEIRDHDSTSVVVASIELLGGDEDRKLDLYPEGVHIHDNIMANAGEDPPQGDPVAVAGGSIDTLLPTLIRVKNPAGPVGAHVIWDGLYEELDPGCAYPTGVPADERGEPQYRSTDPNPECRHNAYKFNDTDDNSRERPDWFLCIENNTATQTVPTIPFFLNFGGADDLTPGGGSNDVTPHQCASQYDRTLPNLPAAVVAPYTPSGNGENVRPTDAEIAAACNGGSANQINRGAFNFDCPTLQQYNLFNDPEDPTTGPRSNGVQYDLNTPLFSDYALKPRFVFLPPGEAAQYRDGDSSPNATYLFPVGTVIAKSFIFPDDSDGTVDVVETRLLIKRENSNGVFWEGLPYIWEEDASGNRVARLALGGGNTPANWQYNDPDTGELITGSTQRYTIPNANQCTTCHSNLDNEPGDAPIGLKPRNLNRGFGYPSGNQNQIEFWVQNNLLEGAPDNLQVDNNSLIAAAVPRIPKFNNPGDSGLAGNGADLEARVRAYLETNCAHCHNREGAASNTGLFLDSLRVVDNIYGICKSPIAAGEGSGGRSVDIRPENSGDSIIPFRVNANDAEARMPPIARSVVHTQGRDLLINWIDNVVVTDNAQYPGSEQCGGAAGSIPTLPVAIP